MADNTRCLRCRFQMSLDRHCKYDDGVEVRVYLCKICTYIHVETAKVDDAHNWHGVDYVI